MAHETFQILAVSLGLGLLVGFEREWGNARKVAGLRTFALVTLLGTVCGFLARAYSGWILAAAFLGVVVLVAEGHILRFREGKTGSGLTTEAAALAMFAVGAALTLKPMAPFIATGGVVAVLLQWKRPLHRIVEALERSEVEGLFRLVLIGLVVLPALPDRVYGPYDVLNPFRIWLMVVLIVGISLGGYISYKLVGVRTGILLGGLFGGIISSTATTVGYARRASRAPVASGLATVVVLIATGVQFVRIAFEIGVVAPGMLRQVATPLGAMGGVVVLTAALFFLFRSGDAKSLDRGDEDPAGLKAAIVFGLLYAVVLLAAAAARDHFGRPGLYVVSGISGLTEMHAITLSAAQMVNMGRIGPDTGWRMIVVGSLTNLVFKTAVVGFLGPRRMLLQVGAASFLCVAAGAALLAFWPSVG